jgi:hypothetical protein
MIGENDVHEDDDAAVLLLDENEPDGAGRLRQHNFVKAFGRASHGLLIDAALAAREVLSATCQIGGCLLRHPCNVETERRSLLVCFSQKAYGCMQRSRGKRYSLAPYRDVPVCCEAA